MLDVLRGMQIEGYAESTIEQYGNSFDAIGWLLCRFGSHDTFSLEIFIGEAPLEDAFREHISPTTAALQRYRRAWRKLVARAHALKTSPTDVATPDDVEHT